MPLQPGVRLGSYEVLSVLGAGGMGEVYRARDTKLNRDVAIKVLPDLFVADPERFARFRREAQVLAALNHPHVAQIYGFEDSSGSTALVLELVDGPTLASRLSQGALTVADALRIAKQIAEALEAAHDKGIIHRDLKPGSIALTQDDRVKVLDFGLAKAVDAADAALGAPPTVTSAPTIAGAFLGTAAYMSPEQARGKAVDKRTDIWAFGCVLFELLTGRRAFEGETISDTVAAVLDRDPDWRRLPASIPARIDWLLRRCLEKDAHRRLHDIADARIEIEEALAHPSALASVMAGERRPIKKSERLWWAGAVASLILLSTALWVRRPVPGDALAVSPRAYSAAIILPDGLRLAAVNPAGRFALSPDGRYLVMSAVDASGKTMLWLRPLDTRVAQPIAGTEGASFPFWSPDSRFIAFLAETKLKKVGIAGGDVNTLCDAAFGSTGAWNTDDTILFTPRGNAPLFRVAASGGTPVQATTLDTASGDVQHSYPSFLPDGRHFLYFVVGSKTGGITDPRGIYVGTLDQNQPGTLVVSAGSSAKYAQGHLVFVRQGTLLAQPFDPVRLTVSGQAKPLVEQVQVTGAASTGVAGGFSVSQTGVLTYQTGLIVRSQLAWFNRDGISIGTLGDAVDNSDVELSPDGTRVAVSIMDPPLGTRDIWIFDVARGLRERFTFDPGEDFGPNWSQPDASRIVFSSRRGGSIHLYEKPTQGGTEQLLLADELGKFNPRVSPDGKYLVYVGGGGIISRSDLWVLPLFGDRKAFPFFDTSFIETHGQFSPDGRWLAYTSNESGQYEVYVTSFPGKSGKWRVSTAGGGWPRWNRNGKEIFYLAPNNDLIAVPLRTDAAQITLGAGHRLFAMRPRPSPRLDAYQYAVTADGQRFLVNTFVDEPTSSALTLILDWPQTLNRR